MTKTMTTDQFIALLNCPETTTETKVGYQDDTEIVVDYDGETGRDITATFRTGYVSNTLRHGTMLDVSYSEYFQHPEFNADEPELNADCENWYWDLTPEFVVTEDDGYGNDVELDRHEIEKLILDNTLISNFSSADWETVEDENLDSDTDKETDEMTKFELNRDNDRNVVFTGELIGSASSSPNNAHSNYSGGSGRWSELNLYKTAGGKFVCHSIGRTQWQGEYDRFTLKVCETEAEVIEFFGAGWLAKELYEDAGIDATEAID
jgi:hypothetical protein